MAKKILGILLLAAAFGAGWAASDQRGEKLLRQRMGNEVTGLLGLHVESLTLLRVGQSERGMDLLETSVDAAILSLAGRPSRQLSSAKAYRTLFPYPSAQQEAVEKALAAVPPATPGELSPALRQLQGFR